MGFELQRAEFHFIPAIENPKTAFLHIDGKPSLEWIFHLERIDKRHVCAVAYGPLTSALPGLWESFAPSATSLLPSTMSIENYPNPPMQEITVSEILQALSAKQ